MDDFMKMVGADVVFPMHFWGDFEVTDRFKALECAKDYKDRIVKIHKKGRKFPDIEKPAAKAGTGKTLRIHFKEERIRTCC